MHLSVLRSLDEMRGLADEWNNLLSLSASHVPFLRHEYLTTWWQTLGGGEWSYGELYVAVGRQQNGQLAGIAPLFFTENREGEPALMFLGSTEISDYLDVIASPQFLSPFLGALLEFLDNQHDIAWRVLDWYNILESSPTLPALKSMTEGCSWKYVQQTLQHCPYIPLAGDWDAYLTGIDKKQRHEIRRKMRRAEANANPLRWYLADDPANLDFEIEAFFDLMAQDAEKARFLTDQMRSQLRATLYAAAQSGWLQLAFIEVDGQKAAGYLNFDYAGRIWVYNSGLNFEYRELSPGWVLLAHLLRWANENQRTAFDFMRGDEDYKYRFGAVDRFIVRAQIRR